MSDAERMKRQLIEAAREATGWSEPEVRAFIRCIRGKTPDALINAVQEGIAWARRIEMQKAVIELMQTMPDGALEAEWTGTEMALRINPEATINEITVGHIAMTLPKRTRDD